MTTSELEKIINKAFDNKQNINEKSDSEILKAVNQTIELTDKGKLRVAEKKKWEMDSKSMGKKSYLIEF